MCHLAVSRATLISGAGKMSIGGTAFITGQYFIEVVSWTKHSRSDG